MSGTLEELADLWETTAITVRERALLGDPSSAIAIASTLESCAAGLRAAITPCLCGRDSSRNGARFSIVCPKHDGVFVVSSGVSR